MESPHSHTTASSHEHDERTEVESLLKAKRFDEAWKAAERVLRQGEKLDPRAACGLLKNLGKFRDKQQLGRSTQVQRRLELVERSFSDEHVLNGLLEAYFALHDVARAEKLFSRMKGLGIQPSLPNVGALAKAFGAKNDAAGVLRVWADLREAGALNTVTLGCVLDACIKCGHYATAEDVFEQARKLGMHRNTILYTTLIKGYARQRDLARALQARDEMKQEGVHLNCVTYNSLLDCAIKCKDYAQATELFAQMQADQLPPDLITYTTVMKMFCERGDLKMVLGLLTHLRAQGLQPDEICYNSLLEGCVRAADAGLPAQVALLTGLDIFAQMQSDCQPSNITFAILVKLYARADGLDQALKLVQSIEQRFRVRPSNIVFATLVKALVAGGRANAAGLLVLGLPQATGLQPDQPMYVSVLPALLCGPVRDLELACGLVEQLAKAPGRDGKPGRGGASSFAAQLSAAVAHVDPQASGARELKATARRVLSGLAFDRHVPKQGWDWAPRAHVVNAAWAGSPAGPATAPEWSAPWDQERDPWRTPPRADPWATCGGLASDPWGGVIPGLGSASTEALA